MSDTVMMAGSLYELKNAEKPGEPTGIFAWCISETPGTRGRARLFRFQEGWCDVLKGSAPANEWRLVGSFVDVLKSIQDLEKNKEELLAIQKTVTELQNAVSTLSDFVTSQTEPEPEPEQRKTSTRSTRGK